MMAKLNALVRNPIVYVGLLLFGASFMLAFQALPIPKVSVAWSEAAPLPGEQYIPAYKTPNGSELTLIYIGTSTCYACNVDYLPETIEQLKLLVQQKANAQGRTFVAQGISLDWGVKKGVEHLEKMGLFDEITAGRNWFKAVTEK